MSSGLPSCRTAARCCGFSPSRSVSTAVAVTCPSVGAASDGRATDASAAQGAGAAAAGAGAAAWAAVQLDARDEQQVAALLAEHSCDVLMNATDPRFVLPLYRAALRAGTHYLDMAMSLSRAHQDEPYSKTGVKLGDEQFSRPAQA